MSQPNPQAQLEGLATLLILNDEVKKLHTLREFSFFTVNETRRLLNYHTAYLWRENALLQVDILAQSGIAELDIHAPMNQAIKKKISEILKGNLAKEIHQVELATDELPEMPAMYLLWCPFLNKTQEVSGGLIYLNETAFTEAEIKMLQWLISNYEYSWKLLTHKRRKIKWKKIKDKPVLIGIGIALLVILLFPTRLSVLGTGTVVPKTPILINAPIPGVIKSFAVNPGDAVTAGQLLFLMDKTDLEATADVTQKDLMLTQTKLRTTINQGFDTQENRAEVPILQAQLGIDQARLDYTKTLLAKTEVKSPANGIVVFDSKEDWIGQPVRTGERILVIANPQSVELKIALPISDMISLRIGAKGKFFLYGQFFSLPIRLKVLGYNAKLMPNKILAYQLIAEFADPHDQPQLGAQGTVRLYGRHVPFIYYLLRRPIQALRQTLGA